MKSMRKTVEKSDLLDDSKTDFYEEMMDKEVAVLMAKRGSLGLAKMLESQLQKVTASTQEVLKQKFEGLPVIPDRPALNMPPAAAKAFSLDVKVKP